LFVGRIHKDRLAEYKERHAAVWPEMLDALKKAGFNNYSLFLNEEGLLVGYFESPDAKAALEAMAKTDVNARWQGEMAPFFVIPEGKRPDQCLEFLGEVFHMA
ncbi:MAG: L-rhamnose mutarotase, partial [Candidatus Sumerlaeia bacterium]|nr:L-rhamnose mutarotase [Candidatus Sumerlaeia bacterium]